MEGIKKILKEIYFIKKSGSKMLDVKHEPISTEDEYIVSGILFSLIEYSHNATQFLPKDKMLLHSIFSLTSEEKCCISFYINDFLLVVISVIENNDSLIEIEGYLTQLRDKFSEYLVLIILKTTMPTKMPAPIPVTNCCKKGPMVSINFEKNNSLL